VIVGEPTLDVDRCIVTWMPSIAAIQRAVGAGVPLIVCHEPTFWHHLDDVTKRPRSEAKRRLVEDAGLVIMRNHDSWDRWPEIGIPWAWARFLGLGEKPVRIGANGYQHRYDIPPLTLGELAERVAEKCSKLGEPLVQVVGSEDQIVSKIGSGTGCGCEIQTFLEMGCDCSIVCDDGTSYWGQIQMAKDLDHPVIRVNHGTSEEPGMATLTEYINRNVDGVGAEHMPHGCCFSLRGQLPR
jgi:putative NIF3 family GTP cyclohydrolase 1 type 2